MDSTNLLLCFLIILATVGFSRLKKWLMQLSLKIGKS